MKNQLPGLMVFYILTIPWFCLHSQSNGGFFGNEKSNPCPKVYNLRTDAEVENMIKQMLAAVGTQPNFGIVPCPQLNNCQATVIDGMPYILYDPVFFDRIKGLNFSDAALPKNDTDWQTIAILAHEIGHHFNQHLTNKFLGESKSPITLELEADEFAGFMLYQLGATLQEALTIMRSPMINDEPTITHPGRSQRITAMSRGWQRSKDKEKIVEKIVEKPVDRIVEKIVEKPVDRIVEKIVEKPVDRIVNINIDDRDTDGLADMIDRCPDESGVVDNFGCPVDKPVVTRHPGHEARPDMPDIFWQDMVYMSGGSYTMGCTFNQGIECGEDEKPVHLVHISPFFISKYEVTQAQWRQIMGSDPLYSKRCDECAVEQVSWDDIQVFIKKLNEQTGRGYRLPTEAEWEFAARGGGRDSTLYAGSNELEEIAWYAQNARYPNKVGSKKANRLSLFDLSGNVWEWCNDWYSGDYYGHSSLQDPQGPATGAEKVLRGGAWYLDSRYVRIAYRNYDAPDNRDVGYGFRLVAPL